MNVTLTDKLVYPKALAVNKNVEWHAPRMKTLTKIESKAALICVRLWIFLLAAKTLKKPALIIAACRNLIRLNKETWGSQIKKVYKTDGRYYTNLYTPGWPSVAYNAMMKNELLRHAYPLTAVDKLCFIFFAVTRKCPMRCEHCFEWDNLNQKETFTGEELKQVVDIYQKQGVMQIHFSGGEPLVRIHDLAETIAYAKDKSECFVATSGFNLTRENAMLLKNSGCRGIVVSIDHYIPVLHNRFRNHPDIFNKAVEGVKASLQAGMLTTLSVCTTKEFIDDGHLLPYLEFAKTLGVHFVQLLEPKNIGHYSDKDVLLEEKHLQILEDFFTTINHDKKYKDYPVVMYHGYHQRRIGCYAGSRSLYIDSAGDVHACPFCHTKSYNIKQVLNAKNKTIPVKENLCPRYGKIA